MTKNFIIWIMGIIIAVMSGLVAAGAIAKNKAPQLALSLQPINGFAAENLASTPVKMTIAQNDGQFPIRVDSNAIKLAEQAFLSEPVTPEAIAVLALGSAENKRHRLMYNALSLSRRQPLITGWMIADSGARADIPTMLTHYDTVVRTSSSAATVVIPTMANALANDDFVEPFASLLTKQPPWAEYFWATVVGMPGSLGNAARLRERLHKSNESDEAYRDADLIQALISNQQFDKSADLYHLLVGPKKSRNLVENSSFSTESVYPPFDWQLFSTGEYGAVIVDGKLELSAIRNSGGLFARQLIKMPRRVLTMKVSPERRIPSNAQIFVTLSCAQSVNGAPQSTRIPLKTRIDSLQIDNSRPGCSFYWLDITGRASENGVGFDIALDSISLR